MRQRFWGSFVAACLYLSLACCGEPLGDSPILVEGALVTLSPEGVKALGIAPPSFTGGRFSFVCHPPSGHVLTAIRFLETLKEARVLETLKIQCSEECGRKTHTWAFQQAPVLVTANDFALAIEIVDKVSTFKEPAAHDALAFRLPSTDPSDPRLWLFLECHRERD